MRNLRLTFDCMYCRQKQGEDFAKFCGLLRIYELYHLGGRMEKHSLAIGSKAFHTVKASFNIKMARNMLDDSSKAQ